MVIISKSATFRSVALVREEVPISMRILKSVHLLEARRLLEEEIYYLKTDRAHFSTKTHFCPNRQGPK